LIGERSLANQAESQRTTHFTARVHLAKKPVLKLTPKAFIQPSGSILEAADIYGVYFHGPAYQVLEKAWCDGKRIIGLLAKGLPPNHHPSELPTIIAPRLIESCFQTAGVWEMGVEGRMGLPKCVHQICLFRQPNLAEGRLYAVVIPGVARQSFTAEVLDEKGNCYLSLNGYQTVALPDLVDAKRLRSLQASLSGEAVAA